MFLECPLASLLVPLFKREQTLKRACDVLDFVQYINLQSVRTSRLFISSHRQLPLDQLQAAPDSMHLTTLKEPNAWHFLKQIS